MQIRPAEQDDLQACLNIHNHYVAHSVATFDTEPMVGAAGQRWYENHQHPAHPLLVAEDQGRVLGYGCLSRWSQKKGYDTTAEVSVFISHDQQRRGAGAALLQALLVAAQRGGLRNLLARIEAENHASIRLFTAAGFRSVGVMHDAGFKFGRWLDVEIMERLIESDPPAEQPDEVGEQGDR